MNERVMTSPWENVRWHEWDAMRCVAGDAEMIVGVSAGPRILSLRWRGGPNLMHRDETHFGVGDWRMFGGHRLSLAPETPASYLPDNAPCTVLMEGRQLMIETTGDDGLRRTWTLTPWMDGDGFEVEHAVTNEGPQPWQGALWAITCVGPQGIIVSPCEEAEKILFADVPTDADACRQWNRQAGFVVTTPRGLRGKADWQSDGGWLALLRSDVTFMIQALEAPCRSQNQPATGNVEVFVCREYLEMETLGATVTLTPGERADHRQRWRLLPGGLPPEQWSSLPFLHLPDFKRLS